jgi:cytochrome c551/c552
MRRFLFLALVVSAVALVSTQRQTHEVELFKTSDQCMACHNGMRTTSGEDVSIGASWRASMMANAARDPYWQAGVRREVIDHPSAALAIQDECAACHMPMARTEARASGAEGEVFAHLPVATTEDRGDRLAHDGVACSLCHQITEKNLGTRESFTGGYVVTPPAAGEARGAGAPRRMFGPFQVERGLATIMRSATGFEPAEATHVRQSELCATCHTLITKALGPAGEVIGELPEQVPYHEWKHSAFAAEERSCQSCHMPVVEEETPIASVLGAPRKGFARHTFVGGNFFMQRMLNRYRDELGVTAPATEMEAAARATIANLQNSTAELEIEQAGLSDGRVVADVLVRNLTGHKLPTGYPSRRVWLRVRVLDRNSRTVFESGAIAPTGAIAGNDNDADPSGVEPHFAEIRTPDQVQIYESVMGDRNGRPTTGLLTAVRYLKDNRLLPRGFDKGNADPWIAVVGGAAGDTDFAGAGDRVRYLVDVTPSDGPFRIDVELRYQVIGFRWAENLRAYKAAETTRFVSYYESMAPSSSEVLARQSAAVR